MVKNLIAAFDQRIERLDWMSPETKVKARRKLSTLAGWRRLSGHVGATIRRVRDRSG